MDLEEIRRMINSGEISRDYNSCVVDRGVLSSGTQDAVEFEVVHGWDICLAASCDDSWAKDDLNLMSYIDSLNLDDSELKEVLSSIQSEDNHWCWFKKAYQFSGSEYEWFFLYAEGLPQGACVIYHPKGSELRAANIFYVEYLAVAPWNRSCSVRERRFKGVGSNLLRSALKYSTVTLGLTPGFSLHSLPQATVYYEKLKMVRLSKFDKGRLCFFELPVNEAGNLLGTA